MSFLNIFCSLYFESDFLKQFYGKTLWEGIQYPKEAIYMPHGLVHAVLNVDDTVAITENYLFVDALPGKYFTIWSKL